LSNGGPLPRVPAPPSGAEANTFPTDPGTSDVAFDPGLETGTPQIPKELDASVAEYYFLGGGHTQSHQPHTGQVFDVNMARRDFPALHQRVNGKPLIWLDNAATTHKPQAVIDAVSHFYAADNSNVHRSAHALAARATDAYEGARARVQLYLGARSPSEIVFVRGTTEAINLVAQAWGRSHIGPGDEIVLPVLEHHANFVPWYMLSRERGAVLRIVPITDEGEVRLDAYERLLNKRTKLVALTHTSNVLGTVLPVSLMTQMAHRHGACVLVDGAQAVPHFRVNVQELEADFYVFSGHKLFAPMGIGVLYGRQEALDRMAPWQGGGSMIEHVTLDHVAYREPPARFEAGTPSIGDAVGLGAAIDYLTQLDQQAAVQYEEGLLAYATQALLGVPGLRLIGTAPHKVGVLSFTLDDLAPEDVARLLDHEGIAVRAGHHCAQPTMQRYGVPATLRASLAFYNTYDEIETLVSTLHRARKLLHR
jgi:cysteine desulfurase/selenocysteine lyase